MENSQELKLNLETAKRNPIGFTQWLAMELLKRAKITQKELNISVWAVKSLNKYKPESYIDNKQKEFEQYQKEKESSESKVTEEFQDAGDEDNGKF